MLLTAFVVCQLALDLVLVLLIAAVAARRRVAPARMTSSPPGWYEDFVRLAEELLTVTEPVLSALEAPVTGTPSDTDRPSSRTTVPADRTPRNRHGEAFALLRAGAAPDVVLRRAELRPGELELIQSLVAAEASAGQRE